jgi:hypothetical protein
MKAALLRSPFAGVRDGLTLEPLRISVGWNVAPLRLDGLDALAFLSLAAPKKNTQGGPAGGQ